MPHARRIRPAQVRPTAIGAALLALALLLLLADARPRAVAAAPGNVALWIYPNGKGSVTVTPAPPIVNGAPRPEGAPTPERCASSDEAQRTTLSVPVCRYAYPRGTTVTLEAAPDDAQQTLKGWSHVSCPDGPRCVLTLTDDEEYVAALFSPQTLLVQVAGAGTVSTSDGKACTPVNFPQRPYVDCGRHPLFGFVTLVASGPDPVWSPSLCDIPPASSPAGPTCTILSDRLRWASVGFGQPPGVIQGIPIDAQIKVKLAGSGSGRVSWSTKIDCPGACTFKGTSGARADLTATEAAGSRFVGWKKCAARAGAPKQCTTRLAPGGTVMAVFDNASAASKSSVDYRGRSGTRGKRRVHFAVDMGASGNVRASLIRDKRNYAKPFSRSLGKGFQKLSLVVKSNAPKGSYRLKVTITGSAPGKGAFDLTLPR